MEALTTAIIIIFVASMIMAFCFTVFMKIKWQFNRNAVRNEYIKRRVDDLNKQ